VPAVTDVALRPAEPHQIRPAGVLVGEGFLEAQVGGREIIRKFHGQILRGRPDTTAGAYLSQVDTPLITIGEVVGCLKELASRRIDGLDDLLVWNEDAGAIAERIKANPDVCDMIPEVIWHYLHDSDIRARDVQYAIRQESEFQAALSRLGRG
jgi:hypothetical protein